MSNQDLKIKKVIDALSKASESVRNNPSEQNYRKWEGKIEKVGNSSNWHPYILVGVIVIICICAFVVFSGGVATQTVVSDNSYIKSVYVDHNVYEGNQKGMRIYVTFDVDNRKNETCVAIAYFYFESGKILQDFNGYYTTKGGQVAVGQDFTPPYNSTQYTDLTLFMPYEELHMGIGDYDLKFEIELYEEDSGALFAESNYYYFRFSSN